MKKEFKLKNEEEKYAGYMEVLKNESYRKVLILLTLMNILNQIAPNTIEYFFFVRLHSILGFQTETIMTIGTLQRIIFVPLFFFSSFAIEKFGRRPMVLAAFGLLYIKAFVVAVATSISYFTAPSIITMALGVLSDCISGIMTCLALPGTLSLLNCELTDPSSKIAITQLTTGISILVGSVFLGLVPYAFNFFPPLPYFGILTFQPAIIAYIYRNLPETAGREMNEIVEDFEEAVRSRAPTRRTTVLEETTPLLSK